MDYEKIFYEETATNNEKTWASYKMGTTGSFATTLCKAYELADLKNKRRLELAFPRLFSTAIAWFYSETPDKFLMDILKGGQNVSK